MLARKLLGAVDPNPGRHAHTACVSLMCHVLSLLFHLFIQAGIPDYGMLPPTFKRGLATFNLIQELP